MTYGLPARLAELTLVPVSSGRENEGALLPSPRLALDAAGLVRGFASGAGLAAAFLVTGVGEAFTANFVDEAFTGVLGFVLVFLAAIRSSIIATYSGRRFR